MRAIMYAVAGICFSCCLRAQPLNEYQRSWFIQSGDTLPYRILFPENYDASKEYPLIVFLHGRGESGRDNQKQLQHGAGLFLTDSVRRNHPAIVVFPQCAADDYWSNVHTISDEKGKRDFYFVKEGPPSRSMELLLGFLENLFVRYKIKASQVYAMGLSMGGMGVFELVRRRPALFAAAIPICGGANPATAAALRHVKWWVFHGAQDDVVDPVFSETMVKALLQQKATVRFTLYPEAKHNSWDAAFAEAGLLDWLFAQHK